VALLQLGGVIESESGRRLEELVDRLRTVAWLVRDPD
jgi:hypothetical protein